MSLFLGFAIVSFFIGAIYLGCVAAVRLLAFIFRGHPIAIVVKLVLLVALTSYAVHVYNQSGAEDDSPRVVVVEQ